MWLWIGGCDQWPPKSPKKYFKAPTDLLSYLKEDCYNKLRFKAHYFFAASGGCPDYLVSRYRKPRPKYEIYNILVCFFGSDSHSDIENRGIQVSTNINSTEI